MTKQAMKKALAAHQARKRAAEASSRLLNFTVAEYPATHNPYLPHERTPSDCFAICEKHGLKKAQS